MIVQIYEIQEVHEAEIAIELGVDNLGSVLLSEDKWRLPLLKEVFRLTKGTKVKNSLIPLFSNLDAIYRALDYYQPNIIHFCDTLTDINGCGINIAALIKLQTGVKEKFPEIKIMRSIPIPRKGAFKNFPSLKTALAFEPFSDIFLTDTWLGQEPVEGYIGITGKTVDWETAAQLIRQSNIPVILAGGLSPENVYHAIWKTKPAGVDSCTQTNRTDKFGNPIRFKKDFIKVEKFINEVRRAEARIP